jgi:hypothetical protein
MAGCSLDAEMHARAQSARCAYTDSLHLAQGSAGEALYIRQRLSGCDQIGLGQRLITARQKGMHRRS